MGAVFASARFSLVRISIRDLVAVFILKACAAIPTAQGGVLVVESSETKDL